MSHIRSEINTMEHEYVLGEIEYIKIARFRVFDRNTRHLIHLFEEDRHNDTLHLIHYLAIEKSLRSHWVYLVRSTPQMKLMIDQ